MRQYKEKESKNKRAFNAGGGEKETSTRLVLIPHRLAAVVAIRFDCFLVVKIVLGEHMSSSPIRYEIEE
jgi:hypothetical protein